MKFRNGLLVVLLFLAPGAYGAAVKVSLGTAGSFAVLAGSTVTNTGDTTLSGNLGVSPGSAITGFAPGIVTNGTTYAGGSFAATAESDLTTAYNFAAGEPCIAANNLSGQDLGGLTVMPGVYCFSSDAQLTGTLTLDAQGDANAVFLFQIASALTAAGGSTVGFVNGGSGANVFWQVGSSATIGTNAVFEGTILANTSVTLNTGASIPCGNALASGGAVTLDSNNVVVCNSESTVAEPGTTALLGAGMLFGLCLGRGLDKVACFAGAKLGVHPVGDFIRALR